MCGAKTKTGHGLADYKLNEASGYAVRGHLGYFSEVGVMHGGHGAAACPVLHIGLAQLALSVVVGESPRW